jgi:putative acetyltransferase
MSRTSSGGRQTFAEPPAQVSVRPALEQDAAELAALFHASVREIGARHYSREQVRAWSPAPPEPSRFIARMRDGRLFLVAVGAEGSILAYGDVEANGHIDHLYARPDAAGSGVAAQLYERLEQAAREAGIERLFVEASEPAWRFFQRRGFRLIERNEFEIAGVAIHNFRMEKRLGL